MYINIIRSGSHTIEIELHFKIDTSAIIFSNKNPHSYVLTG